MQHSFSEAKNAYIDWLSGHALPLFASRARHDRLGYFEALQLDGSPRLGEAKRLRVQARQAFSYARADSLGLWSSGREASDHAWDFMLKSGLQPPVDGSDDARFVHKLNDDGTVLDASHDTYDHAFVLLAAAERFAVYGDTAALDVGKKVWQFLETLKHPHGGYREGAPESLPRRQNPHMHLLEAALLWKSAVGPDPAERVVKEALTLFQQHFWHDSPAALREFFSEDWSLTHAKSGIVEPGHMAEWVWLLDTAGFGTDAQLINLLERCRVLGLDEESGLLADSADIGSGEKSSSCRLWPQTEHVRACLVLARRTGDEKFINQAALYLNVLNDRYLSGVASGCYHDEVGFDGTITSDRSPTSLIYHHITLADELVKF